jgi:hypothetical protein
MPTRARFWEQLLQEALTAVSFLLWLLYVHQASAQFAGHWTFRRRSMRF